MLDSAIYASYSSSSGAYLMPFWTFFLATLLGKGVFKVNGQNLLCVALFMRSTRERWVRCCEVN